MKASIVKTASLQDGMQGNDLGSSMRGEGAAVQLQVQFTGPCAQLVRIGPQRLEEGIRAAVAELPGQAWTLAALPRKDTRGLV